MIGLAGLCLSLMGACPSAPDHAALLEGAPDEQALEAAAFSAEQTVGAAGALLRGLPAEASVADRAGLAAERYRSLCARDEPSEDLGAGPDRGRLDEIFRRAELAGARDRNRNALKALMARLEQWLMALFQTEGAGTFAQLTRTLVLAAALLVGAFGVLRLLSRRRSRAGEASAPRRSLRPDLEDPSIHLQRARAAEDPREAIREGLLCLLSALERRQLARPDRVKTNRELASELPERGAPAELSEAVGRLVRWYDQTFYSLDPVPPAEALRFVEEVSRLRDRLSEAHA